MQCPLCKGKKKILGLFPVWAEDVPKEKRKPYVEVTCHQCEGNGEVPDEMTEWIKEGKKLKDKRIEKRLTLRKAAKKLGIDGSELSYQETGRKKPYPHLYDNL